MTLPLLAGAYVWVAQPTNRIGVLVGCPLMLLAVVALIAHSLALDPATGRIISRRFGVKVRAIELRQATKIAIAGNGMDAAMLGVKAGRGVRMYVPLLHLSDNIRRSLDSPALGALATAMERFSAPQVAGDVPAELRTQAAYVAQGGPVADSPLSGRVTNWATKRGGQTGVASTISQLLR